MVVLMLTVDRTWQSRMVAERIWTSDDTRCLSHHHIGWKHTDIDTSALCAYRVCCVRCWAVCGVCVCWWCKRMQIMANESMCDAFEIQTTTRSCAANWLKYSFFVFLRINYPLEKTWNSALHRCEFNLRARKPKWQIKCNVNECKVWPFRR